MKIAFVSAGVLPIPPVNGGAVENLVDFFLRENEKTREHEITVYSIHTDAAILKANEYKYTKFIFIKPTDMQLLGDKFIRRFHKYHKSQLVLAESFLKGVLKQIKGENYDKIIVENRPHFGYFLKKVSNAPLILHLHNDMLNSSSQDARKIYESFDEIYVISEYIKKRVSTIEENLKIKVLYNGIDTDSFIPSLTPEEHTNFRKKLGINEDDFVILYSGRIIPHKGVKELVKAFNNIPNNGNIKLLILGSAVYGQTIKDAYYSEIEELITTNKSNIIFTGYIPYSDLPQVYELANIGCVPSMWEEPATLTTPEMMAMKLPVVITNVGGIPELVTKDCAIIVNKDNEVVENLSKAFIKLIEHNTLRQTMAKEARLRALKFTTNQYYLNFNLLLNGVAINDEK